MKLYEVHARIGGAYGGARHTNFYTSNTDAMRRFKELRDMPGAFHVQASLVELRTNLVAADWIKLLESDAPGMTSTMVPGDLITSRKGLKLFRPE